MDVRLDDIADMDARAAERLRRAERIDQDIAGRLRRERLPTHVRTAPWIDRAERGMLPVRIERAIE